MLRINYCYIRSKLWSELNNGIINKHNLKRFIHLPNRNRFRKWRKIKCIQCTWIIVIVVALETLRQWNWTNTLIHSMFLSHQQNRLFWLAFCISDTCKKQYWSMSQNCLSSLRHSKLSNSINSLLFVFLTSAHVCVFKQTIALK